MAQIIIKPGEGLEERVKKLEEKVDRLEKLSPKYDKETGAMNFPTDETNK